MDVPEMEATAATAAPGEDWEDVGTSLGEEHDFSKGPLIGNYIGSRTVETEKIEAGEATARQFAPAAEPDSIVFVWDSYAIRDAFTTADPPIKIGDLVKITSLGSHEFSAVNDKTGKSEPRIVKSYRVQVKRI